MKRTLLLLSFPFFVLACKTTPTPSTPTACPPCANSTGPDAVVATIGKDKITMTEVDKAAGQELFDLRMQTLDRMVMEKIVAPLAKAQGLDTQAYLLKQAEAKVPEISEAEARKFFTENQAKLPPQLAGKTFEDVKDMIIKGLTSRNRQTAMPGILEEIKKKASVTILLQPPRVDVSSEGPSKGPKTAKVTIVEFSDFECPYCSRGKAVMDEVVKAYGDKVRVVFRDFPLEFHAFAKKAAEAGQCANEQGKFWAMHDWMFEHQKSLSVDDLKSAAKTLGLDSAKFDSCLTSGKFAKQVADNMKAGQDAGVKGTPAFFVNGMFISGAQPFEVFKEKIDQELAR